jgi:hypothetical protein
VSTWPLGFADDEIKRLLPRTSIPARVDNE